MSASISWPRHLVALFGLVLVVTSCQATAQVTLAPDQPTSNSSRTESTISGDRVGLPADNQGAPPAATAATGGKVDFDLTRDDIDCDEDALNVYNDTAFVVAHVVVDGNLGAPCWGEVDDRLVRAWRVLATITPPAQLSDLGLFGGYESAELGETTLAYVNTLDYDGSQYQMSINLEEAELDPAELQLTVAHEFSHVITSLPGQIDRYILPEDCTTWDNGEGCFREDSLMWEWIEEFWSGGLIDTIDPFSEPTNNSGLALCEANPAFLGTYAASRPEEDFAESFSAFVFRLDVRTPELEAKMDWFAAQPGLVEFRTRAIQAGLGPLRNEFQRCG